MNNKQITCDPERIELFLGQKLSDEEQTAFELHLDDCNDCRHRLEATAAGDDVWSAVRDSLRGEQLPPDCPRPGDFALDSATGGDASFSHDTVLKLLAPTDDDRMLGRLGTYEVVGVIGSGGMGVVLKAFDGALNRYVAIKVLAPHLGSSGAARKRFSREAQAAAAVVHDNVMEIYGVADAEGLPYLVMPYVRGPSLQRRLDCQGPLALVEILRIAVQAASGLAAAHAQGLVHRDVKPANILLADGVERVRLTDFGLARAADDASLTRTGVIAGTPQYMSPEQARGEVVDQRSDLFSLGSVLYAMCTGRAPFRAETSYGVLRRITDEEPRPIREINPDIPQWLCRIIAKLMSKQPDDRFESAREVAELLEECLAHVQQPTAVPLPASLVTQSRGSRFFSTSPRSLGVIAMIAAFVMSLLGVVLWQSSAPPDAATPQAALGQVGERVVPGTVDATPTDRADRVHVTLMRKNGHTEVVGTDLKSGKVLWRSDLSAVEVTGEAHGRIGVKLNDGSTAILASRTGELISRTWKNYSEGTGAGDKESNEGVAWGKAKEGIRCAVSCKQTRLVKGEALQVGFDVENRSEDGWVVRLSQPLVPHGVEWDGNLHRQVGSPRGELFTLDAHSRINATNVTIQLDHWYSDEDPLGTSPKLAQGRHTLRLAFYGQKFKGRIGSADYEAVIVYSQPVEIEIVKAKKVPGTVDPAADNDPLPAKPLSITGRVISIIGRPAAGYRVTALPRAWSTATGELPTAMTENGTFLFRGLPDGPCDVAVTSTPLTNQPNIRIEGIVLKKGKPVHVELSLEQKYHFAGRVTDTAGKPQPDCHVLAIWKDPSGENTYSSNTKTNSFGRYHFSSPFPTAKSIQLNGPNGHRIPKQLDVKHGRDDIDFGPKVKPGKHTIRDTKVSATPDFATPKLLSRFTTAPGVKTPHSVTIAYSADGKLIAIANGNPTITSQGSGIRRAKDNWKPSADILDAETGKTVVSLKLSTDDEDAVLAATERVSHFEVKALAFSPDGSVVAVGTSIGQVKLFNARTGELVRSLDDKKAKLADKRTPKIWQSFPRAMGTVASLAFSPDGSLLAVCGDSFADFSIGFDPVASRRANVKTTGPGRLKVWEVKTGTPKHDLVGHSHAHAVAFSPDGNLLASAGQWYSKRGHGAGVRIWNPHTGENRILRTNPTGGTHSVGTHSVAFSPDTKLVASGSKRFFDKHGFRASSGAVSLTHVSSGVTQWLQTVPGWAKVAFSPDGKSVAVLCGGPSIRFLETETGKVKHEIPSADSPQGGRWCDFAIAPQAHMLAIGGLDNERKGSVELWDLGETKVPGTVDSGTVDSATPKRVHHFTTPAIGGDATIAYSADGQLVAIANGNPTMILQGGGISRVKDNWKPSADILDAETGKTVVSLKLTTNDEDAVLAATERVSHFEVKALAFSPDGSVLAVGTSIGQVKLFNARTGELVRSLDDKQAKLKETPKNWQSLDRAMGSVASLAFSPDGSLLAVCGGSFADSSGVSASSLQTARKVTGPGRLKVWEVKTGTLKHDLAGHGMVRAVAFSPDGNLLASAGDWSDKHEHGTGVIVWNPHTGAAIRGIGTNANGGVWSVAFSPDSKLVAIGSMRFFDKDGFRDASSGAVTLTDVSSGVTQWLQTVPGRATRVAFSPDGESVAVLCGRRSIRFLETEKGKVKHEIPSADSPQAGRWCDFAIAPQAHMLAIGGVDNERKGSVELWDFDAPGTAADSARVKDGED